MGIQTITTPAGEEMVIMSRAEYEALLAQRDEAFEDGMDVAAFDAAMADARPEDILPSDVTAAILGGKGRARAYREWRGLSLAELSHASGLGEVELAGIESEEILLSRDAAARIAEALDLPTGWLAI
ncbi:MAG: helix-turn-helix transcriptional regulator [Candidatus Devosia phytovorans]|uniref:Helix-turn-helix transcriptional regulator n=1 Tax=Candidatus Devosia phytovorans TaxID=3121372 RepID=A0AAJ5VVD7_9HYPH|nr:helix-turn-helix transcriptional regulator [Devosia sp.]WEK04143.1 MAG: helix-turn-helix transcriptional regulator [Devosia sp.]